MVAEVIDRWRCRRCGELVVAAGHRASDFHGIGAFAGECPWGCGELVDRGFRGVRPGAVRLYPSAEWDRLQAELN